MENGNSWDSKSRREISAAVPHWQNQEETLEMGTGSKKRPLENHMYSLAILKHKKTKESYMMNMMKHSKGLSTKKETLFTRLEC